MADNLDTIANLARLSEALNFKDPRITEIITLHVAVERELELALERLVRRPGKLRQLGHANRIKVFQAVCPWPERALEPFVQVLEEFSRLRNAVAHGESSPVLDRHIEKMRGYYTRLISSPTAELGVAEMAAGIFGFFTPRDRSELKIGRGGKARF